MKRDVYQLMLELKHRDPTVEEGKILLKALWEYFRLHKIQKLKNKIKYLSED